MAVFPETDWLKRRVAFCEFRIAARGEETRPESRLIAAGLQEEAAAALFLLGESEAAQANLAAAGKRFVAEGHARGLLLLQLSGYSQGEQSGLYRRIIETVAPIGEGRPYERREGSAEGADPGHPYQWLYAFGAGALHAVAAGRDWREDAEANLLARGLKSSMMMLSNGLSAQDYVEAVLEESVSPSSLGILDFAILHRIRRLQHAQLDSYHFGRSMSVAAYIDFELSSLLLYRSLRTPAAYAGDRYSEINDPAFEFARQALDWTERLRPA